MESCRGVKDFRKPGSPNMHEQSKSQERMITAAVSLFSRSGYNGVTTKDVAGLAEVSEGNIFRYFPRKRDLFLGAIESELQKLTVRAEALVRIADAGDSHAAIHALLELITEAVVKQPELLRLLSFSALEFGPDIEPLFRKYIRPIVDVLARHMRRCSNDFGLPGLNPTITILSFIATVILVQDFFPAFSGSQLPFDSVEGALSAYTELWYRVLSTAPGSDSVATKPCLVPHNCG
jgi:AcrR family transcriptional regulator